MRGMILAAGRGERMGELTRLQPKPLIRIGNRLLIEYALLSFRQANIHDIIINVAYLGEKIIEYLGDGKRYGVKITYSVETERLEVAGGIIKAINFFDNQPFIAVSADVICNYDLSKLQLPSNSVAHLLLAPNPPYHPHGDFALLNDKKLSRNHYPKFNFAGVGIYHPSIFQTHAVEFLPWKNILWPLIDSQQVTGEIYSGLWCNIGTSNDIILAEQQLAHKPFHQS